MSKEVIEEGHTHGKDYVDPPPAPLFDLGELKLWSFFRALIAEFIATLLFLYVTVATVIGHKKNQDACGGVGLLGIAWAFGGMIFILVYCTAGISGGHINPAVTFGLLLARKVSLIRAVGYMVAQCLGAVCGVGLVKAFMKPYYNSFGGGANTVAHGYSTGTALGAEIIGTFVLVYTVFSATDPKRSARDSHIPVLAPLPIGFAVFMVHLATIPSRSNTDMNNISVKGKKDDDGSFSDSEKGENFSSEEQNPGEKMGSSKGQNEVFLDNKENQQWKSGLEKEMKSGRVSSSPSKSSMEEEIFSPKKENPDGKGGSKKKSLHGSDHSNSWVEDVIFSPSKQKQERKMSMKSKSKFGSSNSSNSFMDSPSPPRKVGCFWCSPKKKHSKESFSLDWESNNLDEYLSDLSTFSVKEQQKRLKKAMKEQEKMSKEAEKIVKWAKQASARMSFHGTDDVLSDDEIAK